MKYIFIFLLTIAFIGQAAEKHKPISQVLSDSIYNYIICLDNTYNYLSKNVELFYRLTEASYKKSYSKIMSNRTFEKHFVTSGETLDTIIQKYNSDIDNIELFRKIVYKENPNAVSSNYDLQSGEYILVPKE